MLLSSGWGPHGNSGVGLATPWNHLNPDHSTPFETASYIAAGPGTQVTGGLPNGRVVILRWETMETLMAWRNSPDYQAALKNGEKYAKYNIIAVNGVKQ